MSYPGTSTESMEPELLFDTKLDGISGFIVADTDKIVQIQKCADLFNRACTISGVRTGGKLKMVIK